MPENEYKLNKLAFSGAYDGIQIENQGNPVPGAKTPG
jgi:hypothetical protein